nr:PadR family transcriptional regulator [Streptococcus pacificus]
MDGCVLQIISKKEIYGYELIQDLRESGFDTMTGGTVYPLLQKLEKKELIKGQLKTSLDGPDRKYFSLTPKGEQYLEAFWKQWQDLTIKVGRLNEMTNKGGKNDI